MKKSKFFFSVVVGGAILLAGCTNNLAPISISKNLNHNLSVLENTVKKLDTINNSYLSNPDIYPISQKEKDISNLAKVAVPIKSETKKIATMQTNENAQDVANNEELSNDANITNFYYYNIKPIAYTPRYLQDVAALEHGDYLSNYISKVKTLYAITSDVIEANMALSNCKNYLLNYVIEIKDLNNEIENGTFEPSNQQIAALNNYIHDIKTTIKRIKRCNGELSNEVNSINKSDTTGITTGIDVVKSNYLKVLNHLDTRITYLKNALTTLEQIKAILMEAQNIVEKNENTNLTQDLTNTENDSDLENNTTIEDNITNENINTEKTEIEKTDNSQSNISEENNNLDSNQTSTTNQNANNGLDLNNENNQDNNNVATNTESDSNKNDVSSNKTTNIDTFGSTINNLDTYKPEVNNENLQTSQNNDNLTNSPTQFDNNTLVNNQNNLAYGTDSDKINTPNGTFQNGIIYQNNLNNGINNGANGFATGNGTNYENLNNSLNNTPNKTNKNVDTFGFNTMVDMLNHGTVNNGINTLNLLEKPNMVNSPKTDNYTVEFLSENKNNA